MVKKVGKGADDSYEILHRCLSGYILFLLGALLSACR